ncbi:MAG: DUF4838 domain-containing protein [Clostridia bacterium]|nr:DUF4838 domain-containing protein [Clostridia bacterium]
MKNVKKLMKHISLALASVSMFSVFAMTGCNGGDDSSGSSAPVAHSPITDALDRGPLNNTLHKVSVTPSSRVFVSNAGTKQATTEYKIITDATSNYAIRAAGFLAGQLENATGAAFKVETYTPDEVATAITVTQDTKYIILGFKDLFKSCGLEMPAEDLGPAGYYIKSYGNNVFMENKMFDGYQMSVLAFLREVVGYDMIAHDTVVFEGVGETLPDMEIIERPDYDYRNYTNWMTDSGLYGMGFNYQSLFTYISQDGGKTDKAAVHNIFYYLPVNKYLEDHPEWYSSNESMRQLCYTAHGDPEEYEAMQQTMLDVMVECVLNQPDQGVVTVTQADAPVCCDCDACMEVLEKDGSISATIIRYMNDLDEKFQAALQAHADETGTEKRTVQIAFFAYHTSYNPPTTPVAEDPTLKCSPNITVFIAPIYARYVDSFYEESNRVYADMVRAWSEYTDNIMAWVYETDYHHYMYPYNTYSSMVDTYYFFKQQGANIIYNEGQRWSENVTCFGKLKEYLDAEAQFDVTISYEEKKDKFFKHYYGPAAEIMEEYYNELRQWEMYLEADTDNRLGGGIYQEIGDDPNFWPIELLEGWLADMDKACKSVAYLQLENPALYEKYIKHIEIEMLFPKFALCDLHAESYTTSQIREMRLEFKELATKLGLVDIQEHDGKLPDLYSRWGI